MLTLTANITNTFTINIKDKEELVNPYIIFNFVDSRNYENTFSLHDDSSLSASWSKFTYVDGSDHSLLASGTVNIYESAYDASTIDASMHLLVSDLYKINTLTTQINVVDIITGKTTTALNPLYYVGTTGNYSLPTTKQYVDASLGMFIRSASTGSGLYWNAGLLDVSVSGGSGDVTKAYVDASISIFATNVSVNLALSSNASLGTISQLVSAINASLGDYVDISALFYIKTQVDASFALITNVNASLGLYVTKAGDTIAGNLTVNSSLYILGNVGIGTANPSTHFHIYDPSSGSIKPFKLISGGSRIDMGEGIAPYIGYAQIWLQQGTTTNDNFALRGSAASNIFNAAGGGTVVLANGGSAIVTVANNAVWSTLPFRIGTSNINPRGKLDITGSIYMDGSIRLGSYIAMLSPDGSLWKVSVTNEGTLDVSKL